MSELKNLVAVVDESGTSSRPSLYTGSDFAVGGLIFPPDSMDFIAECVDRLAKITQRRFKYKHITKSPEARREFLQFLNQSKYEFYVLGFYCCSGAFLAEIDRSVDASKLYGTEWSHNPDQQYSQMNKNPISASLSRYLEYFLPIFDHFGKGINAHISVYWDQRSDMEFIEKESDRIVGYHLPIYEKVIGRTKYSKFHGTIPDEHRAAASLSDILVGDIRQFFRQRGDVIWETVSSRESRRYETDPHVAVAMGVPAITSECIANRIDPLVDEDSLTAGKTPMIGRYWKRLASKLISFAAPDGTMGHIEVIHGSDWKIWVTPD